MQTTLTVNQAIDQAIAIMPNNRQKRRLERKIRNDRFRARYAEEVMDRLEVDPRIQSFGILPAVIGDEAFGADTPFAIDTDKLRELLDILIEYAPKIIDIVLTIMSLFAMLLAMLTCPQVANAESVGEAYVRAELTVCESPLKLREGKPTIFVEEIPKGVLAQFGFRRKGTPTLAQGCPGGVCPVPTRRTTVSILEPPPHQSLQGGTPHPNPLPLNARSSLRGEGTRRVVVSQANYAPIIVSTPQPVRRQWYNHDGLSVRQHAEIMHGHNTAGLSTAQVIAMNDHDHNSWGGGHHPVAGAARSVVRGSVGMVHRTASVGVRTAAAPVAWTRRQQPVRHVIRGAFVNQPVRSVGRRVIGRASGIFQAARPRNIVGRIRSMRGC